MFQRTRPGIAVLTASPVLLLAGAVGLLGGCHQPGGVGASLDRFTYVSDAWHPWTVNLVDTRTGETLWSVDVPVGQQITVGFREGSGPNEFKPDMMDWGLEPAGRVGGSMPNQLPVPSSDARRLEPTFRPGPETPGTATAGSPFDTTVNNPVPMAPAPTTAPRWDGRGTRSVAPATGQPAAEPSPAPAPAARPTPAAQQAPASEKPPVDLPDPGARRPS